MSRTEKLLCDLIALPSVNPAFLPAGHEHAGEEKVAEFLASAAACSGLDVDFREVLPGRRNFLARLTPKNRVRKRVLLAPHLDTVNVASPKQFVPTKSSGRLFGRGACDTKGSVAAMFTALCELAESGRRPAETEIVFAGLVDEEDGQAGSRALAASGFKADLAIVGEPTRLKPVIAHKGSLWLRLETRGKSAHGARPELGKNAVLMMARIVELLETTYAARLRKRKHALLGFPTVNVGRICGGTQANIVPDRCEISVDRRTIPGETARSVLQELRALLRDHKLRGEWSDCKPDAPCIPLGTNPQDPAVSAFLRTFGGVKPAGVDYFCDASVLASGGIPSVVFGPGDIAHAHTKDEWIELRSLERGKELLHYYLRALS
jgi:acetylornithine deacetylase/succinyl-diaminopimelate desuccinylase-like protein